MRGCNRFLSNSIQPSGVRRTLAPLLLLLWLGSGCEQETVVRVAIFDASLTRDAPGTLQDELSQPSAPQASAVAEIIQRVRPDVLLLSGIDLDGGAATVEALQAHYLAVGQHGADGLRYPYVYLPETNGGIPSGFDLDNDGRGDGPGDAWGYGEFPQQRALALLSRYPIEAASIRSFQRFRWREMPDARLPNDPQTTAVSDWYSAEELAEHPLSTRAHADVPVRTPDGVLHLLISQPSSPLEGEIPAVDADRCFDELRLWSDYVLPDSALYLYDHLGVYGGIDRDAHFVLMGNLGVDPYDGIAAGDAALNLLTNPAIHSDSALGPFVPASAGAVAYGQQNPSLEEHQIGPMEYDTTSLGYRMDYVLPSATLAVRGSGVFWPENTDWSYALVAGDASSPHRLTWVDVTIPIAQPWRTWLERWWP